MAFFACRYVFLLCIALLGMSALIDAQRQGGVRGSVMLSQTSVVRQGSPYTGGYRYPGTYQTTYTGYRQPYTQAMQTTYFPTVTSQSNNGMISTQTCDATWTRALLALMLNYDNWKCSNRTLPDGTVQACVITGPYNNASNLYVYSGCNWIVPFFCDDSVRDLVGSMISTQQAPATATRSDYYVISGIGAFKVHPEALTWAQAKAACEAEGTHLATPVTINDYNAVWSLINSPSNNNNVDLTRGVWLGFNDLAFEGDFRTVNGQQTCMFGDLPFFPNQPDGGTTENCLQYGAVSSPTFNDLSCTEALPFVCQQTYYTRAAVCRQYTQTG